MVYYAVFWPSYVLSALSKPRSLVTNEIKLKYAKPNYFCVFAGALKAWVGGTFLSVIFMLEKDPWGRPIGR